ncbi:MAG: hypothetical protein ACYTG7_24150 [Planctomycetota bacterium]|jgi:hypothetical protein
MPGFVPRNEIDEALFRGDYVLCVDGELAVTFTSFKPYEPPRIDPGYTARYLEVVPRIVERCKR